MEEQFLTTAEVAARLRVSVSTVNKWRVVGKGPKYVKVGRQVRYRPTTVADYERENERSSTRGA